jgi:predicted metal-dependent peptidase
MQTLYFNEGFMEKLSDDEILFVLAHEVMHMALEHGLRKQARNHMLWNIACDYALNLVLKDSGFEIWKEALCDDIYKDMSADQIYDKLQRSAEGGGKGKGRQGQARRQGRAALLTDAR